MSDDPAELQQLIDEIIESEQLTCIVDDVKRTGNICKYRECLLKILASGPDKTLVRLYAYKRDKEGQSAADKFLIDVIGHYSKKCDIYK